MDYVVVRVWVSLVKASSPGHAALAIRPTAQLPDEGYVSFAPQKSGSVYGPGKFYPWEHDKKHYVDTGRGVWTGHIFGLDVPKMLRQFLNDLAQPQTYSIFNECATNVRRYLALGGGDKFASAWSRNVVGFWSPDDVEDYARSIIKNTQQLGSFGIKTKGQGTLF